MRECPIHKVQCGLWSLSQHVPCYQSLQSLSFALASGRPPQLLLGFAPLRNWPPKLSFCFVLPLGQPPKLFYLHSWSFCVCFRVVGVGGCGLLVEEGEGREAQTLYNQVFVLYLEKRHFLLSSNTFFRNFWLKCVLFADSQQCLEKYMFQKIFWIYSIHLKFVFSCYFQ